MTSVKAFFNPTGQTSGVGLQPSVEVDVLLGNNPSMDRKTKRLIPALSGLLLALTLGACGWAEWPPPSRVQAVNTPPPRAPHTSPAPAPQAPPQVAPVSRLEPVERVDSVDGSDPVFVGADSVTVGKGDTVYAVSRRHKVSPRAIIEANDLRPPYRLTVGQRLKLPRERRHEVAAGDTLYSISRRYDIDMYTLAKANGVEPPYTIVTGQELRIPAGGPEVRQVASAPATEPVTQSDAKPDQPASTLVARTPPPPSKPAAVSPPPSRRGGFIWPTEGKVISRFGPKTKGLHNDGINISAPRGSEVKAAENGVVAYAGNEIRGFGNLLLIKHDGGWITAYAHNDEILVERGQRIDRGQVIAKVGSTGNVTSPQLHFELRRGRNAVDPLVHLKRS